jgi:hypothetical protein
MYVVEDDEYIFFFKISFWSTATYATKLMAGASVMQVELSFVVMVEGGSPLQDEDQEKKRLKSSQIM